MKKTITMILGIMLVAFGLLGFVMEPVLGLFQLDLKESMLFLLSGVVTLAAIGIGERAFQMSSKIFGILYLLLGVWGLVMADGKVLGLSFTLFDHILVLGLGMIFLWVGFAMRSVHSGLEASSPTMAE